MAETDDIVVRLFVFAATCEVSASGTKNPEAARLARDAATQILQLRRRCDALAIRLDRARGVTHV